MVVQYDRATILALMEGLSAFSGQMYHSREILSAELEECYSTYNRLRGQIEERLHWAQRELDDAQRRLSSAEAEYNAASAEAASYSPSSEDDDYNYSAQQAAQSRADQAYREMMDAQADVSRAEAEVAKEQAKLNRLNGAWNAHAPAAQRSMQALDAEHNQASTLVRSANQDLETFSQHMEQAKSDLYGDPAATVPATSPTGIAHAAPVSGDPAGSSGHILPQTKSTAGVISAAGQMSFSEPSSGVKIGAAGAAIGAAGIAAGAVGGKKTAGKQRIRLPGWCEKNSMQAVADDGNGKTLSLSIGGTQHVFSCDKNGLALAYDAALSAGDEDMTGRISAMFEIETLREDLDLGSGDPAFPQLGGYHRDVSRQDPSGYESHHIPARSVQDESADWLPALSISEEDHRQTASYRGKQNHLFVLATDPADPGLRYKDLISEKISQGGSGYIEALRGEIWDLRNSTGHRYDGGISAFLDAVIDLFATRGIPHSRQ